MNFEFTPEQVTFRDSVRRFAEKHLAAGKLARAHDPAHPWDVAKLMAAQGLLGITVPEADGGYCVRRCRAWMIAGGSIEILKNRIAEGVFERSFSQRPG